MEYKTPLTFWQKINPEDLIAGFSLLSCFLLVGLGHNSFLGSIISTVVGFYFGRMAQTGQDRK